MPLLPLLAVHYPKALNSSAFFQAERDVGLVVDDEDVS